jgi:hypothetical protein
MSDLGLQPREVLKESDRLPAKRRLGSLEKKAFCGVFFCVVACLALFAYVPLVWHSETSNLT